MNKYLIGILMGIIIACSSAVSESKQKGVEIIPMGEGIQKFDAPVMSVFNYKGHEYIVVQVFGNGVSVIHAKHCCGI
jgi:hypothetical protein